MSKRYLLLLLVIIAGVLLYMRPVPQIEPVSQIVETPKPQPVTLPWPAGGQAALGAVGYGVLESHNTNTPLPIASIAKVITALAVLQQKPLNLGEQGPMITLDNTDADLFNYYYLNNGSVAKVQAGEQISEYQALQGMLIPSANNIADSLARWAFGSVDAYVAYANKMVKDMGLVNTTVGSANGFSDKTLSTADDVVKLGITAMQNPVIAQVVGQSEAQIPVAGTIKNVNWLIGTDGVEGIKTGNTDVAGGCYLFAAKRQVAGHDITLVGAILGQPQLVNAISAARPLIAASDKGFEQVTVVRKGQTMGYYQAPWGATTQAIAAKDLSLLAWRSQSIKVLNSPRAITTPESSGNTVGKITAQSGQQTESAPITLTRGLSDPSWWWHLAHI